MSMGISPPQSTSLCIAGTALASTFMVTILARSRPAPSEFFEFFCIFIPVYFVRNLPHFHRQPLSRILPYPCNLLSVVKGDQHDDTYHNGDDKFDGHDGDFL